MSGLVFEERCDIADSDLKPILIEIAMKDCFGFSQKMGAIFTIVSIEKGIENAYNVPAFAVIKDVSSGPAIAEYDWQDLIKPDRCHPFYCGSEYDVADLRLSF